jgi:ComF family protein
VAEVAYDGELEEWMRRFKYPRRGLAGLDPRPGALLSALAADAAARLSPPRPDLVLPVPIHPARLRARGFHPAGVLAEAVAGALAGRCAHGVLRTTRLVTSQTGLDRAARRRNVRDAFATRLGFAMPHDVVLVDDVVTTGATLAACARALRGAGARRIQAVCVARTP